MDNWIDTKDHLPRQEDADCNDNVLVRDSVGEYLVQWFNVSERYHYEWAKTIAPTDAISPKLQP